MTAMQSLRMRSKKARGKAIFAGLLYFIGIIGLAVAAFLPLTKDVEVAGYGVFTVKNFWKPVADLIADFKGFLDQPTDYVLPLLATLFYGLMLLFTVINVLRAISKLDHLCMKGSKRVGFNQNKLAVDSLGKMFSCSYGLVAFYALLELILFSVEGSGFSLIFYITTGAFLLIHIISGPVAGSISRFTVRDSVAEMHRKHGTFSPIVRNVLQFAAIGGIAFFMVGDKTILAVLGLLCDPLSIVDAFKESVLDTSLSLGMLALFALGFVCWFCLLRHAINPTEFYACGKDKGRKAVRGLTMTIFLCIILGWAIPYVHAWIVEGFPGWDALWGYVKETQYTLYAAAVALGMFIIECIMAKCPLVKKCYREVPAVEETPVETPLVYDVAEPVEETPVETVEPVVAEVPVVEPAPQINLPLSPRAQLAKEKKDYWIAKGKASKMNA